MLSFIPAVVFLLFAFLSVKVNSYAITGIAAGVQWTGERPMRTEINTFKSSGAPFDLYILSIQRIQQANESELLSYYQIAGIHGYPTIPWNGAPGNSSWGWGYCPHDTVIFPTWHRAYVELYEQVLWNVAQGIAASYPEDNRHDEYVQAALTFRTPYWDWAIFPEIPDVASEPEININTPTGYHAIPNPLYNYTFHSRPVGNGFPLTDPPNSPPFSTYMSTVRWPDANGQSQNNLATQNLQAQQNFLVSTVYQILSDSNGNYTQIATTANTDTSLEYIHDAVHYFIGGLGGHMDWLQWAGFDPLFWLHHGNVDRIFAIWQALYPNSYVQPSINTGTFAIPPGTEISETYPLSPFFSNNQGFYYISDTVRWDKWFGYTYPEIIDWDTTATALADSVRTKVNQLYNPNAGSNTSTTKAKRSLTSSTAIHPFNDTTLLKGFEPITHSLYRELDVDNLNQQWQANIQVNKFALPNSFNIDLFLGTPPANTSDWALSPNLLGTFAVLSAAGQIPASHLSRNVLKFGQIPLTAHLAASVDRGILRDLEPETVKPLLNSSLEVRVRARDQPIIMNGLMGFQVTVVSRSVDAPESISEFPKYGSWVAYPEITEGLIIS